MMIMSQKYVFNSQGKDGYLVSCVSSQNRLKVHSTDAAEG